MPLTAPDTGGSPVPADARQVVVIGAGPAGLTAAFALGRRGAPATVLEGDDVVGGISRTVEREGWRFDIGGHRFFTKVTEVEAVWDDLLPDDFITRPRLSRIFYQGKYFDYPLKAVNALRNLGVVEAVRCVASYLWVRVRKPEDQDSFEGWVASRFGWRLYRMFFKSYTEKVWGVPAATLTADWAAQRIKNLSLATAVYRAIVPARGKTDVTSLIEEFRYPRLGPGMMWEAATARVLADGGRVLLGHPVTRIVRSGGRATAVVSTDEHGAETEHPASAVISSMPLGSLALIMDPPPPPHVVAAAEGLTHRDFLTVALVVPATAGFPDNWIYIHEPDVRVGRIQNFERWSPEMVKDGRTCLGMEYFVFEGDELWTMTDSELVALATKELSTLGLVAADQVERGYVVRMPKAYPTYDEHYQGHVETIRTWLESDIVNVHPVGRNGMHRYNNQDHSMVTALRTVDNLFGDHHDVWAVNVDEEYLEEIRLPDQRGGGATGRSAPVIARGAVTTRP